MITSLRLFPPFKLMSTTLSARPACCKIASTIGLVDKLLGRPRTITLHTASGKMPALSGKVGMERPGASRSQPSFGCAWAVGSDSRALPPKYRAATRMSKNSRTYSEPSECESEMAQTSSSSKGASSANRTLRRPLCGPKPLMELPSPRTASDAERTSKKTTASFPGSSTTGLMDKISPKRPSVRCISPASAHAGSTKCTVFVIAGAIEICSQR
mmetsp:Transcript_65790/g.189662  ORF Transcript_65790/g.189662 Transcript_65790/m.189662 type:complete len:214 (+) Transcript_65790:209-850(+)